MKKVIAVGVLGLASAFGAAACSTSAPGSSSASPTSATPTQPPTASTSLPTGPSAGPSTQIGPALPSGSSPVSGSPNSGETEFYLADLPVVEGNAPYTGSININGHTYVHGIFQYEFSGSATQTQYDLKRSCSQLTYTAGITDDSPSDAVVQFEVFGDNRRLKSFQLSFGHDAQQAVSVSNVLRLKLQSTGTTGSGGNVHAGWGDAAVRCSSSPSP